MISIQFLTAANRLAACRALSRHAAAQSGAHSRVRVNRGRGYQEGLGTRLGRGAKGRWL